MTRRRVHDMSGAASSRAGSPTTGAWEPPAIRIRQDGRFWISNCSEKHQLQLPYGQTPLHWWVLALDSMSSPAATNSHAWKVTGHLRVGSCDSVNFEGYVRLLKV